ARPRFVWYPRAFVVWRTGRCTRRALAASRAAPVSPDRFRGARAVWRRRRAGDALVYRIVLRTIVGQDGARVASARGATGGRLRGGQGHRGPVESGDRGSGQLPQVALGRGNRGRVGRGRDDERG